MAYFSRFLPCLVGKRAAAPDGARVVFAPAVPETGTMTITLITRTGKGLGCGLIRALDGTRLQDCGPASPRSQ
jgi:hypothetical protein